MSNLGFIPAQESDVFNSCSDDLASTEPCSSLSGREVREFYESVVQERESSQNQRSDSRSRRRRRRTRVQPTVTMQVRASEVRQETVSMETSELTGLRFLRCAHEGDLPGLRDLISRGVDINFQDSFFWTALMCASWSGQRAAVRLLLHTGAAWVGVVDLKGQDARDLAAAAGHSDVVKEFDTFGVHDETEIRPENSRSSPADVRRCRTCRSHFSSSRTSHLSSTVHQFSLHRPPPTPNYCLPPSANGFKMMVRCGWRPGSGLGPGEDGARRPVATVLKRDQAGLGFGRTRKPRVTHFRARDDEAVRRAGERRKEEEVRKEEGQGRSENWERDFRTSFYL